MSVAHYFILGVNDLFQTPKNLCLIYRYGCCADNETEATGPKKQGCPETGKLTVRTKKKQSNRSMIEHVGRKVKTASFGC